MDVFLDELTGQMHESAEQCAEAEEAEDGEEFALVKVTVIARYVYRMVDGKPVQIQVAFPEALV